MSSRQVERPKVRMKWVILLFVLLCVGFWGRGWFRPSLRWIERRYFAHLGDSGPLRFVERGRWKRWDKGFWVRTWLLKRKHHWSHVRLRIARIRPSLYRLELWHGRPKKIDWLMKKTGAVVAINGGVFDPQHRPLGYLYREGVLRNGRLNRRKIDGVFYVSRDRVGIARGRGFRSGRLLLAFQSAPLLIADGRRVSLKRSWVVDRRSAVCLDRKGDLFLMTTDGFFNGLSFRELALLMRSSTSEGGLGCRWGLNLDGGASSQWGVQAAGKRMLIRGLEAVPLYLVVKRRR